MAGKQQKWSLCLEEKLVWDSYCIVRVTLIFRNLFKFRRRSYYTWSKMGYEEIQLLTEEDFVREI